MHTIETELTELEPELHEDLAQNEASANPNLAHVKSPCIPPLILIFYFESQFYNKHECALSL
jgi:hypothetical protein